MRTESNGVQWAVLPRGDAARWSGMYVTMNPKGSIVLSRTTYERLGAPKAVLIMYEALTARLALRPVTPDTQHAYPVRVQGTCGGRVIRAYRLVSEFGIQPKETVEFQEPRLDLDGQLILKLNEIRVSPRARGWNKRRPADDNATWKA